MPLWRRGWTIRLLNNSIDREKGQTHSGLTLTVFAMSESPKLHQITKQYKSRIEKGKIGWHREAQHIFLGTRRRGTRM